VARRQVQGRPNKGEGSVDAPGSQAAIAEGTATQPEELERAISGPLLYFYVLVTFWGRGSTPWSG
jgi:hypothetical protein